MFCVKDHIFVFSFYFALIFFAFVLFIKSPGTRVTLICFHFCISLFLYSSVSIVSIRRSSVGGVARVWGCRGVRVQGVTLKNPPPKSHHSHRMCIFFLTIFVSQLEKSIVLFLSFVRYMWSSFQPNPIHAGPLPTTLKRPSSLGKALRTSSALNFQPMSSKPL